MPPSQRAPAGMRAGPSAQASDPGIAPTPTLLLVRSYRSWFVLHHSNRYRQEQPAHEARISPVGAVVPPPRPRPATGQATRPGSRPAPVAAGPGVEILRFHANALVSRAPVALAAAPPRRSRVLLQHSGYRRRDIGKATVTHRPCGCRFDTLIRPPNESAYCLASQSPMPKCSASVA